MSSVDPVTIQKNEIKALRSIFGKEFKLFRPKNNKKIHEPPELAILINIDKMATIGKEMISLKINFDCPIDYPLVPPKISITDASNDLPQSVVNELIAILNQKSHRLKGEPMIHSLVEEARDELNTIFHKHKSEHDVFRDEEEKILETEAKQSQLKLELLRQRRDSARNESKKEKKFEKCSHTYQTGGGLIDFQYRSDKGLIQVFKGACQGQHRVKLLAPSLQMTVNVFDAFDVTRGQGIKIHQISFLGLSPKRSEHLKTEWLPLLEEDFATLYKLSHDNVLPYLGFQCHSPEKIVRKKKLVDLNIQYLTPDCGGMTLRALCELDTKPESGDSASRVRLPIQKIRGYLKSVLDAVLYLHERNVTHIKIDTDSIVIDRERRLRLCHYCVAKRFADLKEHELEKSQKDADLDRAAAIKKGSKRYDMWKVARLARHLFFYGVPDIETDEADMPSDLIDFIAGLESNLKDMQRHPFLCPEISTRKRDYSGELIDVKQDLSPWKRFEQSSRIPKEFELICKLGEGAFGDVVKVKNIYDNQYYAIKRVRLNVIKKKAARTTKEVQLLSSLNHENIVRYYASWSEEIPIGECASSLLNPTESSSTRNNTSKTKSILKPDNMDLGLSDLQEVRKSVLFCTSSKFSIMDHCSRHFDLESYSDSDSESDSSSQSESKLTEDDNRSAKNSVQIYFNDSQTADKTGSSEVACVPESQTRIKHYVRPRVEKYLMIQMELCEGPWNTLQKCIEDQKLYLNEKLIWRFIREIVSGLEHIHSKNMIHRDLKPTNIFLDHQRRVKIGDLGLAMNISPKIADIVHHDNLERRTVSNDVEKGPVGTVMYICPEMLAHTTYTNKADIYSLGIIVFEMCHPPFGTSAERYNVLGKLRLPKIEMPNEKQFKMNSVFRQLIGWLLNHDPAMRPSASELMQSKIIPPPEGKEMEMRKLILDITKNSSSGLYKLMLNGLFAQLNSKGPYELPLLYQSPYKQFISNTKTHLSRIFRTHCQTELDEGNYKYFTIKRLICRCIESVFVSQGAVEFTAPLLSPNMSTIKSDIFSLLDSEGVVVTLPDNLRVNFANFLINNSITSSKRYVIGPIFQQQEYRRDHPRELIEAAFDIVTNHRSDNKTIEVIHALHRIFQKILNFEHVTLTLELNHTGIFSGVMSYFKIPPDQHSKILTPLLNEGSVDLDYLDTDEFRQRCNVNDNQLTNLKSILQYLGRIDEFEKYLKVFQNKVSDVECCKSIMNAFRELRTIERKLDNFPEKCCFAVVLRPRFVPGKSIYRGLVFRVVLQMQDRFFSFMRPASGDDNKTKTKLIVKYLQNPKQVAVGGDYSSYLMDSHGPLVVTESGDVSRDVSAVGVSIGVSTLLQTVYSMHQLWLYSAETVLRYDCLMNSAVSVVVQYDEDSDKEIRELLVKLWAAGVSTEVYDKDLRAEEYVMNQKIRFFVKFLNKGDLKSLDVADNRTILVKRNDNKGVGLELISGDDTRSANRVLEVILQHSKHQKDSLLARLEREQTSILQKQVSDTTSSCATDNPSSDSFDIKKAFNPRSTDGPCTRYVYKFVSARDSQSHVPLLELGYFVETAKHVQSVSQKNPDIDATQVQLVVKLNFLLTSVLKWFQGRFPNPLYCIVAELSFAKCQMLADEASVKALKEPGRLSRVFARIEASKNYLNNVEKQWKDVLSRIWEALQEAVKEKIFRVLIFNTDENLLFLEIK